MGFISNQNVIEKSATNENALKKFQEERLKELGITQKEAKAISADESNWEDELISSGESEEDNEEEDSGSSCKP